MGSKSDFLKRSLSKEPWTFPECSVFICNILGERNDNGILGSESNNCFGWAITELLILVQGSPPSFGIQCGSQGGRALEN